MGYGELNCRLTSGDKAMIANYILLAYRNLLSNKVASFINIFGLSIAVACGITVFLFLKNYWTLDNFHVNGDRIFMVEYVAEVEGETQTAGDAPAPIAPALAADFPQVEQTVRIEKEGVRVFNKENIFNEILTYADTGFFRMFTFPLKYGNPAALADPNALILSSEAAEKYFPGQVPVGQPFSVVTDDQQHKQFTVQGVAKPFPNNAGFAFDLLTGYHPVHEALRNQDWTTHISGVFVSVRKAEDIAYLSGQMSRYVALYNSNNPDRPVKSFVFDNLRNPAPGAYNVNRRPAEAHHPLLTVVFSAIALLMMGLSCFNYVNISLGSVSRRLKEIGVRKVMGGSRTQLIAQFMAENLLLCFAALLLGLLMTAAFLAPHFNEIMVMDISLSFAENTALWWFLAGLLVFTGLASGAYPALYISAFKPTVIFTGKQKFGDKNTLRRGLLTVQFVLAFMAVMIGVVLMTAGRQWEKIYWGYNPDRTLVVQLTDGKQYELLKNEMLKNPAVQTIAGSQHHIGQSLAKETVYIGGEEQDVFRYDVGAGYFESLDLGLAEGRFFDGSRRAEDARSVVVNESFARQRQWDEAVGKTLRVGQQTYAIAGVVKDFKLFGSGVARPAVFFLADDAQYGYLVARFEQGSGPKVAAEVERIWPGLFAGVPVNHFFQKDIFEGFNRTFRNLTTTFGYIAGLALLIACMGLYGLAAQHFSRRLKEVSMRKALGASVAQIILLVNREFLVLLLIAGLVATGISYLGVRLLLDAAQEFTGTYHPGIAPFIAANLIVLITAAVAVGRQTWKIAHVQLSTVLKNSD